MMVSYEYIEEIIGSRLLSSQNLSGGCIADTRLLEFANGQQIVAKLNNPFSKYEANGLVELSKAQAIKTPAVIYQESNLLLMEYIPSGQPHKYFWNDFGSKLAKLHRYTGVNWEFYENNYIGTTLQLNDVVHKSSSWAEFYWQYRLLAQYYLAEQNGLLIPELAQKFKKLERLYHKIIVEDEEPPVLIYGDLWSGNFLIDQSGNPVLIDPAVYYGHREAELAMTTLFGGFPAEFYTAYHEEYPLADGYLYREKIYQLYHVFNHLNLFGSSYRNQVIRIIDCYLD